MICLNKKTRRQQFALCYRRTIEAMVTWKSRVFILVLGYLLAPALSEPESAVNSKVDTVVQNISEVVTNYKEDLNITILPRNHVLTEFNFQLSSAPIDRRKRSAQTHYKSFPRSLAHILETTSTRELHLRFGQGWWDSEIWGQLPKSGDQSGGIGVELWAIVEAETKEKAYVQWKSLANSLSGLFCASLNFIDSSKTIYPVRSFDSNKESIPLFNSTNELYLLRAALASEPVCTENLTPFIKFLPSRGKAGLSSLLDGHRVFESQWHMMSIDIETQCEDDLCKYQMEQEIDAVVNIDSALRRKQNPIPRPVDGDSLKCDPEKGFDAFRCFPLTDPKELTFTLSDILGHSMPDANFITDDPAKVCVKASDDWNVYIRKDGSHFGTPSNCFELTDSADYDIYFQTEDSSSVLPIQQVPVHVSRSLTGFAQDRGESKTFFKNPSNDHIKLIYLESLPWFMKVYLHTLTVTGGSKEDVLQSIHYIPEVDRQRPTHLEFEITLPPQSNIALSYSFEKSLLLYAEYPPDANHGFSVEPGVVKVTHPLKYSLRTSPALLTLPTPDFSMPYNVIILTSTVMALAFGTIFNLLLKRLVTEEEAELINSEQGFKVKIERFKKKLKTRLVQKWK